MVSQGICERKGFARLKAEVFESTNERGGLHEYECSDARRTWSRLGIPHLLDGEGVF
jgi:hypothetical protein